MIDLVSRFTANGRLVALAAPVLLATMTVPISAHSAGATSVQPTEHMTYAYFAPGGRISIMSGSTGDLDRARALRSGAEGLLYFRQGGAAYVVRDAAVLREAEAIFRPQREIGDRQAALGDRQAALGERQARLGMEQASLGFRQASATPSRAGELGRLQAELGRRQHTLGQQQNVLGRQQSALGREQEVAAREADRKLRALVADAIRRGVARPVN
jgi:hypothetical protein